MTITTLYPQICFYSEDVPNVYAKLVLDSYHGKEGTFSIALINKSTDTMEIIFSLNNSDKSLYITSNEIDYKIATEQYVSNSIQGAISASY